MRTAILYLVAVIGLCFFSAFAQEKGGDDRTGPYDVVQGWPQPLPDQPEGSSLRRPTGSSSRTEAS
jgi:hypothetical protein